MGSPSSVSTARWLGWQCAMAVAASGELWWSAMTLVVLCSSRRMGSHLGVGQFGGKAGRGWNSPGKGKMTMKLWPIPAIAAVIRRSDWSGGDWGEEREGEGLLRAREPSGGVSGNLAVRHRW
jgi:hypothetical protein